MKEFQLGVVTAALSYCLWGVLPIYWKLLKGVDPLIVVCHRTIWSLIFLGIVLKFKSSLIVVLKKALTPNVLTYSFFESLFLCYNWLMYIWAVQNNYILECSLGYFMTPILNIFLGVFLLKEKLLPLQWFAIALSIAAIVNQTISYGKFPFIGLSLALTFALYGLIRKKNPLNALEGLFAETIVLMPFALIGVCIFSVIGRPDVLGNSQSLSSTSTILLLILTGPVTAIPLLFFAHGAVRIPLNIMGMIQYLSPTIQFLLAVLLYKEHFGKEQFLSFILIWLAIAIYVISGFLGKKIRHQERRS